MRESFINPFSFMIFVAEIENDLNTTAFLRGEKNRWISKNELCIESKMDGATWRIHFDPNTGDTNYLEYEGDPSFWNESDTLDIYVEELFSEDESYILKAILETNVNNDFMHLFLKNPRVKSWDTETPPPLFGEYPEEVNIEDFSLVLD